MNMIIEYCLADRAYPANDRKETIYVPTVPVFG